LSGLFSSDGPLGKTVGAISGLAVGTLMGLVREMVSSSVPEMWKKDLTGMVDDITGKLGGKVIPHSELEAWKSKLSSEHTPTHREGNGSAGTGRPQDQDRPGREYAGHYSRTGDRAVM